MDRYKSQLFSLPKIHNHFLIVMSNAATESLPLANGTFSKQKLYNEYCIDVISSDFEYFPHW